MLFTVLLIVWSKKNHYGSNMTKHFNKELAITKQNKEDFQNLLMC